MNLHLPLKRKWFNMTEEGIKLEDYREITPYWCNRFLLLNGEVKSKEYWYFHFFKGRDIGKTIQSINKNCTFKNFTNNKMTWGYPSSTDTDKILNFEHKGIKIGVGKVDWGAEPRVKYFVIKHGYRIGIHK